LLDFVDYPLNDRWWLEDQFQKITALPSRTVQLERLDTIRNWENPGEGGFYDVIGNVARSPHIPKLFNAGDAMLHFRDLPMPTQRWMREKPRPIRFAWHKYLNSVPAGITYTGLDPNARYTVKLFAQGPSPLLIDGEPAPLLRTGEKYDEVTEQEFEVPPKTLKDGRITLNWARVDQSHLNWRQQHYVTDIWVIRHKPATQVTHSAPK
jgi:hypothetical protein